MELVEQVQSNELQMEEGTALQCFALHRGLEINMLDKQIAAVEVINIIRPLVAIDWYDFISVSSIS